MGFEVWPRGGQQTFCHIKIRSVRLVNIGKDGWTRTTSITADVMKVQSRKEQSADPDLELGTPPGRAVTLLFIQVGISDSRTVGLINLFYMPSSRSC